jgi:nucleotide-binding universal stress UspA family protein
MPATIAVAPRTASPKVPVPRPGSRRWRVLVATDGSRGGQAALRFAADLAAKPGTSLTVITVAPVRSEGDTTDSRRRAEKSLASAGRELGRAGVTADLRVVKARPQESIPEAIRRESDRLHADLVVIGSEGRDTLSEWVVGGVALRLIYLATRPVTVVRPPRRRRA